MQTTRGLDRLVFFTDALTAIAITLLILPLVNSVARAATDGQSAGQFFGHNLAQIGAFVLSFVVIARLWFSHHSIFEHVRAYNGPLLVLNLVWTLTIVVLPLPTEMVSQFAPSGVTVGVYIGTMTASSLTLTTMTLLIRSHPDLESTQNPIDRHRIVSSVTTTIAFVVALVVGVLVPAINFYALLVILLTVPLQWLFNRKTAAGPGRASF